MVPEVASESYEILNALPLLHFDIKNLSVKISVKTAESIIKNSIDKNKLENLYAKNLEQIKIELRAAKN